MDRDWVEAERLESLRCGKSRLTGRLTCLILTPIYCDHHVPVQIPIDFRLASALRDIHDRRRL